MEPKESFGGCLQRILAEQGLSASETARLVGFRSRNSIFRILNDETSSDVDARFMETLREAVGDSWPHRHWRDLEVALHIKRVGNKQFKKDWAFCQAMRGYGKHQPFVVETQEDGRLQELPLDVLLRRICAQGQWNVVICGCYDRSLAVLLSDCFNDAGSEGRLTARHYIDVSQDQMVQSILSVLPLTARVWYNARLVDEGRWPEEMTYLYRLNIINLIGTLPDGTHMVHQMLRCDDHRFFHMSGAVQISQLVSVLDRFRFEMQLLKPLNGLTGKTEDFVGYTAQYAALEKDCEVLSIKPDLHFNFVPSHILYPAIVEGFEQSGLAAGDELEKLMAELYRIHESRIQSAFGNGNHLKVVYSLPAMEQFMRTGIQSDHFFIQRAYTPDERRQIVRMLLEHAQQNPHFTLRFLRSELPEIRAEMTCYGDKGVLLLDGYTSYDLHDDHSEVLITLPGFMRSFRQFYTEVLMKHLVMTREESLAALESLLNMDIPE